MGPTPIERSAGIPPAPDTGPWFGCAWPYGIDLNESFTIDCSLKDTKPDTKPVRVKAEKDARIQYDPKEFTVKPGSIQLINVKILRSKSGIALLALHPDGGYPAWEMPVDVGFQGHLKISPNIDFSYDDPQTVVISIVDDNGKAMAVGNELQMDVQAVGAMVRAGVADPKDVGWNEILPMKINIKASVSPQFQIRSTSKRGGTVHLLVSLRLPDGAMLAQDNFSFQVTPTWWLPIAFAMAGSLLYWLYSFVQTPKKGWSIVLQIIAALLGGTIAYLFASFDLLGLKLDPNVLKTYALLGFLFAYVGVEVVLAKRFRPRTDPPIT
jgi:hypothetical protein